MPSLPRLREGGRYANVNLNYDEDLGSAYRRIPRRTTRSSSPFREDRIEQSMLEVTSNRNLNNLQARIEDLKAENTQYRAKLVSKDSELEEVQVELQELRNKCVIQNRLIETLQEEADILKEAKVTARDEENLQLAENEKRVRKYLVEKEEAREKASTYKEKLFGVLVQIGDSLRLKVENGSVESATEKIISKISSVCKEHELAVKKLGRMEDTLDAQDAHTKASRETIMRLVKEMEKEQKSSLESGDKVRELEQELNEIVRKKESESRDNEDLRSRMREGDKLLASCQDELDHYREKAKTYQDDADKIEVERNVYRRELEIFKSSIAKLLGCEDCESSLHDSVLKDKIREMVSNENIRTHEINGLEGEIADLKKKVKYQEDLYQNAVYDLKQVERSSSVTQSRIRELEDDLASGDVLRDTLRSDRTKYVKFLEEMADAMKVGEALMEMGHTFDTDVLIARANQLVKLEGQALLDKTSSNLALRKQIKQLKEKLKNKELHLSLVQKKTGDLQEKEKMRTALAIDRDEAIVQVQKLNHKVERLQSQLGNSRLKNTELKADLADTNELKVLTIEQKAKIDDLLQTVAKLAEKKELTRQKLGDAKTLLKETCEEADKSGEQYKLQMGAVTEDLRSTRQALDEVGVREKQLLDFRAVIAKMLSLDVTTLSVPDYEIISRLEALLRNHHATAAAHQAINAPLVAMDPRFVKGYTVGASPVGADPLHLYRRRPASPTRIGSPKRY